MKDKYKIILIAIISALVMAGIYGIWILASYATITITSDPSNATVYSLKNKCITPCKLKLPVGDQRLWATKDDYQLVTEYVKIRRFKQNKANLKLEKIILYQGPEKIDETVKNPDIANLPYVSDNFRVDWDTQEEKYLIVPVIPDQPEQSFTQQLNDNWQTYELNALAALNWLKKSGVAPTKQNIKFWREEWWPNGKNITL